jgi:hypothetical protein
MNEGKARGDALRQQAAKLEAQIAMYTEQAKSGSAEAKAKLAAAKENLMRIRTALKGKGAYKKGGMVKKAKGAGGYANCGASMKPTQKFACGGMVKKKK